MRKKTPSRLYYSITEVAGMTGVRPHVLRYWETEFKVLRPKKNRAGNRTYRDKDVRLVLAIRQLLYDDGFTIKGARRKLGERKPDLDQIEIPFSKIERHQAITGVRRELEALLHEIV